MERDIDQIIASVREQIPKVQVEQLRVTHPADDDGIWWFGMSPNRKEVQVESSTGNYPFLIETDLASVTTVTLEETTRAIILRLKNRLAS